MNTLQTHFEKYLHFCQFQKRLDTKTLKAYCTDLSQFISRLDVDDISEITPDILENYIAKLHQIYKPKTAKRKIASLKAFFHYMEYKEIIDKNPFNKIRVKFREPITLPKTIPLHTVETFLSTIYKQRYLSKTDYQKNNALRDAAVAETLFATGMRISELCSLQVQDVDLYDHKFLIHGKGSKERIIQIGNDDVIKILFEYKNTFLFLSQPSSPFFINHNGIALSDQAIRRMINKYTSLAAIETHIKTILYLFVILITNATKISTMINIHIPFRKKLLL